MGQNDCSALLVGQNISIRNWRHVGRALISVLPRSSNNLLSLLWYFFWPIIAYSNFVFNSHEKFAISLVIYEKKNLSKYCSIEKLQNAKKNCL